MGLKERREVVALAQGAAGVLFTLTGVTGSSYRRPGARLLVLADGRTAGTLSGGCLEADLVRRAPWMVRDGAVVERYNTAFDDTAEIPYGLGCGGELEFMAEPLATPEADALIAALAATLQGEARIVITQLQPAITPLRPALARIVLDALGDATFASDALPTEEIVALRAAALAGQQTLQGVFIERLQPAQRVVIFGAGEDAKPLTRLAAELGWTAIVADGRANQARAGRFPMATDVVVTSVAADVPVRADDAVVLMTHSYEQDRRLLAELLPLAPRYLGLLGARHRSALLLMQAAQLAGMPLAHAVQRTHAPIGLELGGDGPEAVALAIMAEMHRVVSVEKVHSAAAARRMGLAEVQQRLADGPVFVPGVERCALNDVRVSDDEPVAL